MVDRRFLIEKVSYENNISVICPPFLQKKKQFTNEEVKETVSIAAACAQRLCSTPPDRSHIKRCLASIEKFREDNLHAEMGIWQHEWIPAECLGYWESDDRYCSKQTRSQIG